MKRLAVLALAMVFVLGIGCVKLQDTPYTPQSVARGAGTVALGAFSYDAPADKQYDIKCPPTWYQFNSESTIAEYIKRANYLELKNCGYDVVDNAKIIISATIKEIIVNDFGFGADIKYIVTYSIVNSAGTTSDTYIIERKGVAKGSNYAIAINSMVREGIEKILPQLK